LVIQSSRRYKISDIDESRFKPSRRRKSTLQPEGTTQMKSLPISRQQDLIIEELADEVLVYDLKTDQAHCLNRTSALIWKNCDGKKSEGEIAEVLEQELKSPISVPVVLLGLEELARYGLLENEANEPWELPKATVSRRRLMQNMGLAAALSLPVIMSISAPTAAQAASDPCVANPRGVGCPCVTDGDCDSANCNAGTCGPPLRPAK
jgi:hypothetical protein